MQIRQISLQNVRSFLDRTELEFGKDMSIFVGPNGGGKSTLLDAIGSTISSKLLGSFGTQQISTPEVPYGYRLAPQDISGSHRLERHFEGDPSLPQVIQIELEVSSQDIQNIQTMKDSANELERLGLRRFEGYDFKTCAQWVPELISDPTRTVSRVPAGMVCAAAASAINISKAAILTDLPSMNPPSGL